jgi:hypothetical protein
MNTQIDRRFFLKSAGVALALPALDAMGTEGKGSRPERSPQRMVVVCTSLGLHGPSLFPKQNGTDYELTPYLQLVADHRQDFTLFSGLSHPDQAGADGHSSQMTWLSAARHPGLGGFRNTISVDQYAGEKLGYVTRFPTVVLSTDGTNSQSYTQSGVMIPANWRPSVVFQKMFLQGKPSEIARQKQSLEDGGSVLDALRSQTRSLQKKVSTADRERLDEYFSSLRDTEQRLLKASQWLDRPKPKVDVDQFEDISESEDLIGRTQLLMELIPLIVQTDSSRVIAVLIQGRNDVPPVDGVLIDHHNLSHHGQDENKIRQLQKIETELMNCFNQLLAGLKTKRESDHSLLDNTMVMFGSNLGNANSHDWRNLPVFLAGGGFNHGQHVAFNRNDNTPLCNLFVTMLQKMGLGVEQFASSTGKLVW